MSVRKGILEDVREGEACLKVVEQARVERTERAVDSHPGTDVAVAEHPHGGLRVRLIGREDDRIHVELAAHDTARSRLDEPRLPELCARAAVDQVVLRSLEFPRARWDAGRKEHDARSEIE